MNVPAQIGNYKLEREIGRGATSEVWLARHVVLADHVVAVKLLMSQDRDAIRRFQREAAIAARLRHPNIARLLDFGYVQPFFFTSLEYIEGGSLRQILEQRGRLPLPEALAIFRQIAAALDYAHGLSVVHRDISPGNILVEQKGERALLTDFGIARDGGAPITVTRAIMGTPGYLSPEHMQSATSVTHLSDIFGLGVVLYQMLAAELPWHATPGLPEGGAFSPPLPLKERGVSGLPAALDQVLRKLLAIDPAQRYPSARAAVEELDRIFQRHEVATQIVLGKGVTAAAASVQLQAGGVEPNAVEQILGADLLQAPIDRAHKRADELRKPESVAAMLDAWAAQDRLRRRPLLGRLARFHKVASHNLYFFQLRVLYERRSAPEAEEEPDKKAQVFPLEPELEPWAVKLPQPKQFEDEPGGRIGLPGSTRIVVCGDCSGRGTTLCPNCGGKQRIYITRTVPAARAQRAAAATAGQSGSATTTTAATSAQPTERTEQVLVPCPECSGRGGIDCVRCTGIGRLVQRQFFRWSRQARLLEVHDELPHLNEAWLSRACKPELVYTQRQIGGLRPEWALVPRLDALAREAQAQLNDQNRIALSELTISFIPVTDVVFDLGKPGEGGLYKLAIYGFEHLIPPDWRFFNWERVTYLCLIGFLVVLLAVALTFHFLG